MGFTLDSTSGYKKLIDFEDLRSDNYFVGGFNSTMWHRSEVNESTLNRAIRDTRFPGFETFLFPSVQAGGCPPLTRSTYR